MPRTKHSPLVVGAVALCAACASSPGSIVEREAVDRADPLLAIVGSAARNDATIGARFVRSVGGYATFDGALRSTRGGRGAALPRIVSRPPSAASDPWRVAVDDLDDASLTLVDAHAAPAAATTIDGRVVYRDAYASTDEVQLHDGAGAEELLVLRDARAPSTFAWQVARGRALVGVRAEADGALSFVDARGRARLQVARPFAIDDNGVRRQARLGWSRETLTVDLDTRGLAYPIVLDPYVGTARWTRVAVDPGPRHGCAAAAIGSNLVLFGGKSGPRLDDTWTWNGSLWKRAEPTTSPAARAGATMAAIGGKAILFGGIDATGAALDDTWSWDGAQWTQLTPIHSPAARGFPVAASLGSKIVLYGGAASAGDDLFDTWVFDGADWSEIDAGLAPVVPTENLGVAFASTGATATFASIATGETWTFDGAAWTDLSDAASTPMATTNNDGLEALGVADGLLTLQTTFGTYRFESSVWTAATPADAPPWRMDQCSASLGDALALFGGDSQGGDLDDFWIYAKGNWSKPFSHSSPTPRAEPSVATLDDRVVLFGGVDATGAHSLTDTWEFDGKAWTPMTTTTAPGTSASNAMANGGDVALLFDGSATWTWDHKAWTRVSTAHAPDPYQFGTLARIGATDVLVTTQDVAATSGALDTWVWSGADWSHASSAAGPALFGAFTPYAGAGLYFDPYDHAQWSWNGAAWSAVAATTTAPLTALHSFPDGTMAAAEVGRFALVLGDAPGWSANEAWLWDGAAWGQLAIEGLPLRNEIGMATLGSTVFVFGGGDAQGILSADTYALDIALSTGTACAADAECDSAFCAQGVCCDARCGDPTSSCALPETRGTCAPIEAICVDSTTLRGADGTSKSCAPYLCAAAACPTSCAASADCVGGFVCDPASQTCVAAPSGSGASAGCGLGASAISSRAALDVVFATAMLGALAARARRRRAE